MAARKLTKLMISLATPLSPVLFTVHFASNGSFGRYIKRDDLPSRVAA